MPRSRVNRAIPGRYKGRPGHGTSRKGKEEHASRTMSQLTATATYLQHTRETRSGTTATEYINTVCAGKHIWRQGHKGGNKVRKLLPMERRQGVSRGQNPDRRIFLTETELLS